MVEYDNIIKNRMATAVLDNEDSDMMELVKKIIHGWENLVVQFLNKMIKNNKLPESIDTQKVSRHMIHLYVGAATPWRITNDETYINDLEHLMARMLE